MFKTKSLIIIFFMIILLIVLCTGCARWPYDPSDPGETDYKLKITVQVYGELNVDNGNYYIVLDTDGNPANGPGEEVDDWEDEYYYIQLDDFGFYFTTVEEGSSSIALTNSSISEDEFQVTISLNDLGNPENSIEFNVVTTDSNNNTYDYLADFLTIGTSFGSIVEDYDSLGDAENEEDDFDIIGVTAEIVIL